MQIIMDITIHQLKLRCRTSAVAYLIVTMSANLSVALEWPVKFLDLIISNANYTLIG